MRNFKWHLLRELNLIFQNFKPLVELLENHGEIDENPLKNDEKIREFEQAISNT